jgi:hypothetical protein
MKQPRIAAIGYCDRCANTEYMPITRYRGMKLCHIHYDIVKQEVAAEKKQRESEKQRELYRKFTQRRSA